MAYWDKNSMPDVNGAETGITGRWEDETGSLSGGSKNRKWCYNREGKQMFICEPSCVSDDTCSSLSPYLFPECRNSILATSPTASLKSPVYSTVPWAPSNRNLPLKHIQLSAKTFVLWEIVHSPINTIGIHWSPPSLSPLLSHTLYSHNWSWAMSRRQQSDDNILWLKQMINQCLKPV